MAKTGHVTVRIDDKHLRERVNELAWEALAEAWDQGYAVSERGGDCPAHEQRDWCPDAIANPYRQ